MARVAVSSLNSSRAAGTQIAGGVRRQSGSSASSGPGSRTQPDNECAPTAAPFSSTQTLRSDLSCLSLIAQARPAGPPPTISTSYSIWSRSIRSALMAVVALVVSAEIGAAQGLEGQHSGLNLGEVADDDERHRCGVEGFGRR